MTDQLTPPDPQVFDPRDYQDPLNNPVAALAFQGTSITIGIGYSIISHGIGGTIPASIQIGYCSMQGLILYGGVASQGPMTDAEKLDLL